MQGRLIVLRDAGPFKHIMGLIVKHHGSIKRATNSVGISNDTYRRLVDENEVTFSVGTKIMAEYERINGVKNAA